jgi:hypothetical protein
MNKQFTKDLIHIKKSGKHLNRSGFCMFDLIFLVSEDYAGPAEPVLQ